MKVVCINDRDQNGSNDIPRLVKGNVYTVMNKEFHKEQKRNEGMATIVNPGGYYYELIECGSGNGYFEDMLLEINDGQQDETTFERNYNKETA